MFAVLGYCKDTQKSLVWFQFRSNMWTSGRENTFHYKRNYFQTVCNCHAMLTHLSEFKLNHTFRTPNDQFKNPVKWQWWEKQCMNMQQWNTAHIELLYIFKVIIQKKNKSILYKNIDIVFHLVVFICLCSVKSSIFNSTYYLRNSSKYKFR